MAGCTVVEFELMATAAAAGSQQRAQTLEHVDGAEVVHGGQQRAGPARVAGQPGAGHDAGQRRRRSVRSTSSTARSAPLGRREVGDDVRSAVLVDADDVASPRARRAARAVAAPMPEAAPGD